MVLVLLLGPTPPSWNFSSLPKIPIEKRSSCLYECPDTYIGQTGKQLGLRIKEHKPSAPSRISSAVKEHSIEAHHTIDWDNVKILDREDREFPRQVKKAIQIRKHSPALNRDQGRSPQFITSLFGLSSSKVNNRRYSIFITGVLQTRMCVFTSKYWGKYSF